MFVRACVREGISWSNKRPAAHEFVKLCKKRLCLRGVTSTQWETLTFLLAYK